MKRLFLKAKPCKVLLLLKDSQQAWYPSKLARESGSSYVHVVNLLGELRKAGVVALEKKGRQNYYKLNEKGAYLALSLDDFSKKCEAAEAEMKQQAEKAAASPQALPLAASQEKQPEKASVQEKK